ncbi:MAG: hypothetical protein OEU36_24300 [Gammaproteobacteria bacterium]|nr:hypothetical protein [Gammaproteobacteria bacterium]
MNFTQFFGQSPDLASPEDLRRYQLYMVERGVSSMTLNAVPRQRNLDKVT